MATEFLALLRRGGLLMLAVLWFVGCSPPPGGGGQPAAEKPRNESDLAKTTLSAKAVKSLGIQSADVSVRPVQEHRQLHGWLLPRQGNEVTLTAPLAGIVREVKPGAVPVAGTKVDPGTDLFKLEPIPTALEQVQLATLMRGIEGEVKKAKENVTLAKTDLERTESLYNQKPRLKTLQDVQQAQNRLALTNEDLATADAKLKLFEVADDKTLRLAAFNIKAPKAGTIVTVPVNPGQYVPAGTPLISLADLTPLWVRVPVPEYDLPRVNRDQPATLKLGKVIAEIQPVALVPLVDLMRHTADQIYKLAGKLPVGLVAKDQMVTVLVPIGSEAQESVVPYSAVIFDAYGGTWIYLDRGADPKGVHTYERRYVLLGAALGNDVVVRPTLRAGDRVVVEGAGVLFSREFFKPPLPNAP
jgi:RND family efflux transporter MFP subunit